MKLAVDLFDPETLVILETAFDEAWITLSPRAVAGRLRRAQTSLRALGIEIVFGREGRLGTRTIRITAIGEHQSGNTVSTFGRVSDNKGALARV